MRQFLGTYQEFRDANRPVNRIDPAALKATSPDSATPHEIAKSIRRLKKDVASCEEDVADAERNVRQIEEQLAAPEPETDLIALTKSHAEAQQDLESKVEKWESCASMLDGLLAQQG